jgi:hypothetical protein
VKSAKRPVISKSKFVSGVQCPKKLYFEMFRKDLKPPISVAKERLFSSGRKVGELAWEVYPDGKDASMVNFDVARSLKLTREWLDDGESTIYEAAFSEEDVLAFLDILHHKDGERWAIEVKSSTSVKEYHYTDAALQYWVMNRSGFRPDHFILMHINNEYVKDGEIEPHKIFSKVDITNAVLDLQLWVSENLGSLRDMIANGMEPVKDIGPHCDSPFECDFKSYCWKHVPEHSVFELSNANGKDWKLYGDGVIRLADIPDDFELNPKQQIQVKTAREHSMHLDIKAIHDFLGSWKYPLHFFDFETVGPAIPMLNGTKPFEQVPFQYSLHKVVDEDAETEHYEFLSEPSAFNDPSIDPRSVLIESLKDHMDKRGSIVAYNARFERGVIERLALVFPGESEFLRALNERFVDLWDIYRKYWWYMPEMKGSGSIKNVLPAIAPEFSYGDLEVQEGGEASALYQSLIEGGVSGNKDKIMSNLLDYCRRDTEGMVVIWKALQKVL